MKKKAILFLVLILMFGLTGCFLFNPPTPGPDPKPLDNELTQEELWDYLDDYPCYLTQRGIKEAVIVFSNDSQLNIDGSHIPVYSFNYKYSDLKSFSYEGENIYKVEYENFYENLFDSSIFYIEFDPEIKNRLKFGTYYNGELEYQDLYADEGLTLDELIAGIAKYDYWFEVNGLFGYNFIAINEDNMFYHGLMNTSYARVGKITKIEYLGLMLYEVTIDYPAVPDGIDPGHEAYCKTYYMNFNPYGEMIEFENVDGNYRWFYPDKGLTKEELFTHIGNDTYLSYDKRTRFMFTIKSGKYFIEVEDVDLSSIDVFEVVSMEYKGFFIYETVLFNGADNETWSIYYDYHDANDLVINASYFYIETLRE